MFFSLWVSFFSHFFFIVGARFICYSLFSHIFLIFVLIVSHFFSFFLIVVSFFLFGGFIELTGGESSYCEKLPTSNDRQQKQPGVGAIALRRRLANLISCCGICMHRAPREHSSWHLSCLVVVVVLHF